ncbi:MAG: hypothetical protein ACI3V5_09105 [Faecousia sp.]
MSEQAKQLYFRLLSEEIVSMFGVTMESATKAVQNSAIQNLINDYPEYVDHVPLSSWAEDVHEEMFS